MRQGPSGSVGKCTDLQDIIFQCHRSLWKGSSLFGKVCAIYSYSWLHWSVQVSCWSRIRPGVPQGIKNGIRGFWLVPLLMYADSFRLYLRGCPGEKCGKCLPIYCISIYSSFLFRLVSAGRIRPAEHCLYPRLPGIPGHSSLWRTSRPSMEGLGSSAEWWHSYVWCQCLKVDILAVWYDVTTCKNTWIDRKKSSHWISQNIIKPLLSPHQGDPGSRTSPCWSPGSSGGGTSQGSGAATLAADSQVRLWQGGFYWERWDFDDLLYGDYTGWFIEIVYAESGWWNQLINAKIMMKNTLPKSPIHKW